jgi:opacity protein-like surface antigen
MNIHRSGVNFSGKATDASFAWFAGAGLEFDIGRKSGWSAGLETRYNAFRFDTDKLIRNAPAAVTGDGNRLLSYISLQLRVNKRF